MKTNSALIILAAIMLFCYACNKNGLPVITKTQTKTQIKTLDTTFTTSPITASIIGKWYVNKQRLQTSDANMGTITDTTYSVFNTNSYYQFNADSTATFTQGTIFFTSEAIEVNGTSMDTSRLVFTYHTNGSTLTIKDKDIIPVSSDTNTGPYPLIITQLDANTLALHGINTDISGKLKWVLDISLTRGQ